jgi:H+/Cl- antiporter ClcA
MSSTPSSGTPPEAGAAEGELSPEQVEATIQSRSFLVLLVIAGVVGAVVSLVAWGFLELIHQIQQGVFVHLPSDLGYHHGPPLWWSLPVLAIAGLIVAFAIVRLPGNGGHIPAKGLASGGGATLPLDLPGIMIAALATIGLGVVLGPEAPLIALGSGVAVLTVGLARREVPPPALMVIAAAGSFAAVSFLFESPLIAAVIMIEATGLGGPKLRLILIPGLLASGIGSLVSIGMGSWTGLSTSAYALGALSLPAFPRPTLADFGWTIALAGAIGLVTAMIVRGGRSTEVPAARRPFLVLPVVGLIVAGLAIGFHQTSGKPFEEVLFSGQDALPGLVAHAPTWSLSALALLVAFKGVAYSISLGSFRGGPTFPAIFLGAAAGIMAAKLPGFSLTPAVAVGMAAGTVAVLRLPLSAVVIASVLTAKSGLGAGPLVIVGVVVAYVVSGALRSRGEKQDAASASGSGDQAVPGQAALA